MLIVGDQSHHNGRIPWVTGSLLATNVLVFLLQAALGEPFTNGFSLVPKEITEFRDLTKKERVKVKVAEVFYDQRGHRHVDKHDKFFYVNHYTGPFPIVLTLFTSMFLHGDIIHLLGNMWFLVIFGRNVECALDHGRFLLFFVLCGVIGGLAHVASAPHSVIPCLGASGAISGVLGAYVAIHPLNNIKCWFGWWLGVIELPALVVIGVWFLFQYLSAFLALEHPEYGGSIAYWDHLGGFLTGVAFIWGTILYLRRRQAKTDSGATDAEDAPATPQAAADPLESFLPPTAIQAGEPMPKAAYDSYAIYVRPERRN